MSSFLRKLAAGWWAGVRCTGPSAIFLRAAITVALVGVVAACQVPAQQNQPNRSAVHVAALDSTFIIDVAPQREPCTGVGPMQCLRVRFNGAENWQLFHSRIDGFTFESGYDWRLEVLRRTVHNPPADASRYTWSLVRVLERRQVPSPSGP